MINNIKRNTKSILTVLRMKLRVNDHLRWKNQASLAPKWNERTILMSKHIEPGSKVIEFGAGNTILEKHLPEKCSYLPTDITKRDNIEVICDLNRLPLPDLVGDFNTAVFSGVLEYVFSIKDLIKALPNSIDNVVASYGSLDHAVSKVERRYHGWVNDHTSEEIIDIFDVNNFQVSHQSIWRNQHIFHFIRKKI